MYHISWLFLKSPLHGNAILPHGACFRAVFPLGFLLACSSTVKVHALLEFIIKTALFDCLKNVVIGNSYQLGTIKQF